MDISCLVTWEDFALHLESKASSAVWSVEFQNEIYFPDQLPRFVLFRDKLDEHKIRTENKNMLIKLEILVTKGQNGLGSKIFPDCTPG